MKALSLLGRLPRWLLSGVAVALTAVLLLVGGYRRSVVWANLKKAFPNLSWSSRLVRFIQFQRHFSQLIVESAKLFSMKRRDVDEGMVHVGKEVMHELHAKGRHVLIAGGHMNNWEWSALTLSQNLPFRTMALYKKLSNPKAEKAMTASRSRFGLEMVRTKEGRAWMNVARHGEPVAVVMGFDQSPADPSKCWWTNFMGAETAVFFGLEQWSHLYDMAVVYASIRRIGPWKYALNYELVAEDVKGFEQGEVLDRCLAKLEREITKDPARWLWSHKRWKHARPEGLPCHPRKFGREVD